ncbi:succinylglutamate desuccinylase/aspartoacylase family protein [Devosia sp. RR2S18]|uniref:succinylglutamate desuccinylase/aspartoacylase family protein n=1 Tax=Devosia rhizosphaerae TaxID=3049774 RepID=UPI00254070D0|nr:succinylglutamate desuccinylase/aspartoacylase family protein [Devosia sp. RR2S18]WIJ26181.1 M14 family metallopeptidase [Devosia sp. RR2S18]
MTFQLHSKTLAGDAPGSSTDLFWYTAGPEDAPVKVHMQAALHADEQPGTMALHHLLPMLRDFEEAGKSNARFTVFPSVNPLGLANRSLRHHIGRYDVETGINYNRRWPDLYDAVAESIADQLIDDVTSNLATIRAAIGQWIDAQQPNSALQELRLFVLRSAAVSDIVLDLHCDDESLKHIFTSPELMPGLQDLADWMGVAATLTAEDSGGGSFDEVLPSLFRKVRQAHPDRPLPPSPETATLEYRGRADSFDTLGREDAAALVGFFVGRGLIATDPRPKPKPAPAPNSLEATEVLRVDRPGLLAYRVELGERVSKGQPVADLIAMDGPQAFIERHPILAGTDGFILSRATAKFVKRGTGIAKIVGTEVLPSRAGAYLLED